MQKSTEEGDFKDEWDLVDGRQKAAASSLTIIYQAPHELLTSYCDKEINKVLSFSKYLVYENSLFQR